MTQPQNPKFDDLEPLQAKPAVPASEAHEPLLDDLEPVVEAPEPQSVPKPVAPPVAKPVPAVQPPAARPTAPAAKPTPPAAKPAPPAAKPTPPLPAAQPAAASMPAPAAAAALASGAPTAEAELTPEPVTPKPIAPRSNRGSAKASPGQDKDAKKERGAPPVKPGTQSRDLEQAPKHLRIAAMILIAGCLLPWMNVEALDLEPVMSFLAKALILVGGYLFHQALRQSYHDTAPGWAAALDKKIIPEGRRSHGWSVGEFLGLVLMLVGLLPVVDAGAFPEGNFLYKAGVSAYGDKGMLALGCLTISHIYAYSKGAHFSPLFPLMFFGPAIAGITSLFKPDRGWWTAGALASSAAGILAVYTIVEALKQAKTEGDAKRAAQVEARRTARQKS